MSKPPGMIAQRPGHPPPNKIKAPPPLAKKPRKIVTKSPEPAPDTPQPTVDPAGTLKRSYPWNEVTKQNFLSEQANPPASDRPGRKGGKFFI